MGLTIPTLAWAQQATPPYYGPHPWGYGWHGWFFGPLMMIAFVAMATIVVVFVVRWLGGAGPVGATHRAPSKTPMDILRERYARGEIDKAEFEERRKVLGD